MSIRILFFIGSLVLADDVCKEFQLNEAWVRVMQSRDGALQIEWPRRLTADADSWLTATVESTVAARQPDRVSVVRSELSRTDGGTRWTLVDDTTTDRRVLRRAGAVADGVESRVDDDKLVLATGVTSVTTALERLVSDTIVLPLGKPIDESNPKERSCELAERARLLAAHVVVKRDDSSACAALSTGSKTVEEPYLMNGAITLYWSHDCAGKFTNLTLVGASDGWIGVGFVPHATINYVYPMQGGDFYQFSNDGTTAVWRNGHGIADEVPVENAVTPFMGTPTVERNGTVLTATFTRMWSNASQYQVPMDEGLMFMLVARADTNNITAYHSERFIDFVHLLNFFAAPATSPASTAATSSAATSAAQTDASSTVSASSSVTSPSRASVKSTSSRSSIALCWMPLAIFLAM